MKKKILLICIPLIIVLMVIYILGKNEVLEEEDSLIASQVIIEENISAEGYTFDEPNIILNPYEISPLTALIAFETDKNVSPKITIVGKDESTTYVKSFEESNIHYLPVFGLYSDAKNEVIVEVDGKENTFIIETDKLPDDLALADYVVNNKNYIDTDLYFFTPSAKGYTAAYDANGDIRWYLTINSAWNIERLENGNFLLGTDRVVNSPYYNTGLYEIDMFGKIYNEYSIEGGYHHDYDELENGNIIALSNKFEDNTVEDYIVEIDRSTGDIVKSIDLKNILNETDAKGESWTSYDWFHNNSVWYDKETNSLTLSGRHQDAVLNIDYDTEEINWIIGDSTNWSEEYLEYFFTPVGDNFEWQWSQHAAMITPNNDVFVLDNGNNKSKDADEYVSAENSYTRGVIYDIDTDNMTIEQVWQYGKERGSEFYSPYVSDVDYLNDNHYLVSSGGIVYVDGVIANSPAGLMDADRLDSITVEVLNNEVVFEIKLPTNTYTAEKMDLYGEYKYILGDGNRLGTLGETESSSSGFKISNTNEIDGDYNSKDIEIVKEVDRLSVHGTFLKEDEVSVILSKYGFYKKYDLRIAKKPYTALCIDIFTEEETENGIGVYKYINEDNINGTYNIYIELNGVIYDVKKSVNF